MAVTGPIPATATSNYPPEDQRRDEVLCRMLNTPYRPRHAHLSPARFEAADVANPAHPDASPLHTDR